jgi:ATP-dependent Lon protease
MYKSGNKTTTKKRELKRDEEEEEEEVTKKSSKNKRGQNVKRKNPPPSELSSETEWSSDDEDDELLEDDEEDSELWSTEDEEDEEEDEAEEDDEEEDKQSGETVILSKKLRKRIGKKHSHSDDETTEKKKSKRIKKKMRKSEEEEEDEEEEDDMEDEITEKKKSKKNKNKKQNFLVFNIGAAAGASENDDDDGFYDELDEWTDEENSDDGENNYASDDEKIFMKGLYEKVDEPPEPPVTPNEKTKKGKKGSKNKKEPENEVITVKEKGQVTADDSRMVEEEYRQLLETKKNLVSELKKRPNKIYQKALKECKIDIKRLVKEGRSENVKQYHELVRNEQNRMNEYRYFKKNLSHQEQTKIIEDFKNVQKQNNFQRPYRIRILESNISPQLKEIALHKIDQLRDMMPGDPEYHKLKTWIDTFMKIPFGIYKNIDINIEKDGIAACNEYMNQAQQILDDCTYGLEESKLQIMQMLGQWLTNPSAMGTAIAIKGSPGTGKTSLIKDGISKILGREFVFIPLGGAGDSSYLEGHSYTYEGSMWGKIVQTLIDCKCMNPVIYFDELDKVSETPRGEEIIGVLTHLTDTSQNMEFHDKYFAEIREFDLSKCLFIFSYNDETKVNPILMNRVYVIQTKGYSTEEKMVIARKYLLPKIAKQVNFTPDDIVLKDDILRSIITDERYSRKEDGVRNLKRSLEIIYTKLNLYRVMNKDNPFFEKYKQIPRNIDFPHTLTTRDLELLIKQNDYLSPTYLAMYN